MGREAQRDIRIIKNMRNVEKKKKEKGKNIMKDEKRKDQRHYVEFIFLIWSLDKLFA